MPKIFISYSRADAAFVKKLVRHLERLGFDVLLDTKHLRGGRATDTEIRQKIEQSDYFIPVITSSAVRSQWVGPVEIDWALRLQRNGGRLKIVPIQLKQSRARFPSLGGTNYIDFQHDYILGFAQLLQALPHVDYDELFNMRKQLDEEVIQDRSLLNLLRKVATRPGRKPAWLGLPARAFMKEVQKIVGNEDILNEIYWWLIVYGVLQFKNIDRFWDKKDRYKDSVKYAKVATRGAFLMDDLSSESIRIRKKGRFRSSSSWVPQKLEAYTRKKR